MAIAATTTAINTPMAITEVAGRERAAMAISAVRGVIRNADGHRDGATAPHGHDGIRQAR